MTNKMITKSLDKQRDYLTALKNLENKVEKMFHGLWHRPLHEEGFNDSFPLTFNNMPKVDVVDRSKEIVVKAELPGIEKKDIDVSITKNRLLIKAKTSHEEKVEKEDYLKQEISKSEIYRSLLLPADVDDSKVKSSFKNGMLELIIPKQKHSHRKKIEIT